MPLKIKSYLRRTLGPPLQYLGYTSGAMRLTSSWYSMDGGTIVLMYHSVADQSSAKWVDPRNHVPAEVFEQQMQYLAQYKKVIPLDSLIETLAEGKKPANDSVVLTFDDGYLDNLQIAAPILERLGMSATLFLPTGYIDRGETQWVDQAYTIFKYRTKSKLNWDTTEHSFDIDNEQQYKGAYHTVCNDLLKADAPKRRTLLSHLQKQLQPATLPPRLTLTWDEVRTLLSDYRCFQFGGHTLEHTDLTSVPLDIAQKEIVDCALRINEELGCCPHYFSFCYGRHPSNLPALFSKTWVKAAFGDCGHDPVITQTTDTLSMPRVEAPSSMRHFSMVTSCYNRGFWRKIGR